MVNGQVGEVGNSSSGVTDKPI